MGTKVIGKPPAWDSNFRVECVETNPDTGQPELVPSPGNAIRLHQLNRKEFALACRITYYRGKTGLEGKKGMTSEALKEIRTVRPADLGGPTDLVSVPRWMRWFVGRYGEHTPAALVHDRFIGIHPDKQVEGMSDERADRFFRFMLQRSGVSFLKRWIMWAGVAFRTRFAAGRLDAHGHRTWKGIFKRASLLLWAVGLITVIWFAIPAALDGDWGRVGWLAVIPAILSALWLQQFGAGLVAAYVAIPLVLPGVLITFVSDFLLLLVDGALSLVLPKRIGGQFSRPETFEVTRPPSVDAYPTVAERTAEGAAHTEPEEMAAAQPAAEGSPFEIPTAEPMAADIPAAGPMAPDSVSVEQIAAQQAVMDSPVQQVIVEDGWWYDEDADRPDR